jgi:hypothetical protein
MAVTTTPVLVLVAASSAPSAVKDVAEYVCDGTADQVQINTALADLGSTGGLVQLTPGTFNISASIVNAAGASFTLLGSGWGTILLAAASLNDYVIKFDSSTGEVRGARIGHLKVDGNAGSQTAGGGIWARGATQCLFEHLWLHRGYHAGLFLDGIQAGGFGHHNRFMHSLVDGGSSSAGEGNGLYIVSSDENFIGFVDFEDCGGTGGTEKGAVKDTAGLNTFLGGTCVNGLDGIRVKDTGRVRIQDWVFDGVGRDAVIISGYRTAVQGCTFLEGGSVTDNTYSHILINNDAAGRNAVIGNTHTSPTAPGGNGQLRSFVRETGAADNNTVEGNSYHVDGTLGTAKVERNSANGIWRHNNGYKTENAGTTAFGAAVTSVTSIAHGLDVTPAAKDFSLQFVADPLVAGHPWVSAITSTTFTLNVKAAPGGAGTTVGWQVQVL